MTQTAFERDNILTPEERATSARKCIAILSSEPEDHFRRKDWHFFIEQQAAAGLVNYAPTERQLAWLRDITERLL